MSDDSVQSKPLTADEAKQVDSLVAQMTELTDRLKREARHMQRLRTHLAWGATAVAIIAFAALFVARSVTDFMIAGMQFALFAGVAAMNFRGPRR